MPPQILAAGLGTARTRAPGEAGQRPSRGNGTGTAAPSPPGLVEVERLRIRTTRVQDRAPRPACRCGLPTDTNRPRRLPVSGHPAGRAVSWSS